MNPRRRDVLRTACVCGAVAFLAGCVAAPADDSTDDEGPSENEGDSEDQSAASDDGDDEEPADGDETEDSADEEGKSENDDEPSDDGDDDLPERSPLSTTIARLVKADDPEAYADKHDIPYRNGEVRILVQLEPDGEAPDEYISEVETELEGSLIAWVAVDAIVDLGDDGNVRSVRQVPPAETHDQEQD